MKYLSLIVLLGLMIWTFNLSSSQNEVPVATHVNLANELKAVMTDYLKQNVAGIQNIQFHHLYTESKANKNRLTAFVKYSYESPLSETQVTKEIREGKIELESKDNGQTWEPLEMDFKDLSVEFLEDLKIVPGSHQQETDVSPSETKTDESHVEM